MILLLPALLAGVAACLAMPAGSTTLRGWPTVRTGPSIEALPPAQQATLTRLRWVLAPMAGLGGSLFIGGPLGVLVGVLVAVFTWIVLGRAESPQARRRRERLTADLPAAVDLLAAALRSGTPVDLAVLHVAEALGGPVAEEFGGLHHQLTFGVDPAAVWAGLAGHLELGPMGRTLGRAHETGASVAAAMAQLAEELRARSGADAEARAKSVAVKAAAPLGVCFLPAFVLLGVVPLIAGLVSSMRLLG